MSDFNFILDIDEFLPQKEDKSSLVDSADYNATQDPDALLKVDYYLAQLESKKCSIPDDYYSWRDIGFAFSSLGEVGRSFFHRFSALSLKYNHQESNDKFDNLLANSKGRITLATFYKFCHDVEITPYAQRNKNGIPSTVTKKNVEDSIDEIITLVYEGEHGLAKLFAKRAKGKLVYNHTAKKWMVYEKGIYVLDETKQVRERAIEWITKDLKSASAHLTEQMKNAQKEEVNAEEQKEVSSQSAHIAKLIKSVRSRRQIENVLELATSLLPVQTIGFDKDPLLFNVNNGIIDLSELTLRQHSPDYLLTKQVNINFIKNASCPAWIRFLNLCFDNDASLIRYIQKWVGYCLTGLTDEQVFFFCYGSGSNGKSTFFNVIRLLLGPYCSSVPIAVLLEGTNDTKTDYLLAGLNGTRLVILSEVSKGASLNESQLKDLTGQEPITARVIYQEPFTYQPNFKLMGFGNYKLNIKGADHGIQRRMRLIPFEVTIEASQKRNMSEVMAEFREELSGILWWALEGYKLYREEGLDMPEKVKVSTQQYLESSDLVTGFINDICIKSRSLTEKALTVWEYYQKWISWKGYELNFDNSRHFYNHLNDMGISTRKGTGNIVYLKGLGLKATTEIEDFKNNLLNQC